MITATFALLELIECVGNVHLARDKARHCVNRSVGEERSKEQPWRKQNAE